MPFVIDTNVWIDAAAECGSIKDKDMRELCEIRKTHAQKVFDKVDECYVPVEVKKEIKFGKDPKIHWRAHSLIKRSGCRPLSGSPEKIISFESACSLEAMENKEFLNRCASRQNVNIAKNDWRIVAKAAELSVKSGEEVVIISRDSNLSDDYCESKYLEFARKYIGPAKIKIVTPGEFIEGGD